MSHTDLCRGGHNVNKYLDEVEKYLNIEDVGFPDNIQSRVIVNGHTFQFPVTAGDKLCFIILPYPGSPVCILLNGVISVVKVFDRDWGSVCTDRAVPGKYLTPPNFRCTGVQLRNESEGISDIVLKACKKGAAITSFLGEYDTNIFGTSYTLSFLLPNTYYTLFSEFGHEFYYGSDYDAGKDGIFSFLFDKEDQMNIFQRPSTSTIVGLSNPLSSSCLSQYIYYTPNVAHYKHFRVYYDCNSTEDLFFTLICRYELFDGERNLRSSMENSILKHFIDRNKDDPHNFTRVLNYTI